MNKLKSFEQFATEVKISQTRQVEEDKVTKRSHEAETYKSLLSEFKVTSIKELTEDQRSEFFNRLRGAEVNEALSLIEEGTRGQFGKIDKKGNITSVYTHYDSYPENMLPIIKKSFLKGKLVDDVIKRGDNSGLDVSIDKINFYGDNHKPTTGTITDVKGYLRNIADDGGAEYAYLWDEANKEWLMADIHGGNGELVPAFESVSVSVNEAIAVQFKRDAKKVLTVYNNLFAKKLTDFGAMSIETKLGCIKYLFELAMEDANFSREGFVISKNIKGSIGSFEVKMPGLGNYFIKIGATTTKRILDQYYSELANAAGWSGIGIVEGTALYLEQIKQEAAGQSLLNAFNMSESLVIEGNQPHKEIEKAIKGMKGVSMDIKGDTIIVSNKAGDEFIYSMNDADDVADFITTIEESVVNESAPKCTNKKGHLWKEIDKDGTVECQYCGLRNSLSESAVTEAEVNSDEEFNEYGMTVLQKAFGEEFDEAKAKKVIDGILAKSKGDYGTAVGMLTSSLGA